MVELILGILAQHGVPKRYPIFSKYEYIHMLAVYLLS